MRARFVLGVALVLAGCGAPQSPRSVEAASEVPHRRDADDVARFIAGMPGNAGSALKALEGSDAWGQHRRVLDAAWARADAAIVRKLAAFQAAELGDAKLAQAPVFYPFGGPDALTMTAFFPHAPTYVMVGLEPAGTLPTAAELAEKDAASYLGATRETVASVLQDDSGVPYRYFGGEWRTQLYGSFTHPYGSFAWMVQPDLQAAFARSAKPLDLHLSYGYSKAPSNLLLARRVR